MAHICIAPLFTRVCRAAIDAVLDSQLDEARDIFGDDFNFNAFANSDSDGAADSDESAGEADLFGDSDGDSDGGQTETGLAEKAAARAARAAQQAEKKGKKEAARAAKRRLNLRAAFEPAQLVENFVTDRDEQIRTTDVSERLFERVSQRGAPLGPEEAELQAQWIVQVSSHVPHIPPPLPLLTRCVCRKSLFLRSWCGISPSSTPRSSATSRRRLRFCRTTSSRCP